MNLHIQIEQLWLFHSCREFILLHEYLHSYISCSSVPFTLCSQNLWRVPKKIRLVPSLENYMI